MVNFRSARQFGVHIPTFKLSAPFALNWIELFRFRESGVKSKSKGKSNKNLLRDRSLF
jgi:hypothetical protein